MPSYESATRRVAPEKPGLCAIIQDLLPFYLEREISPESQAFVDEHLAECERCASFLAGAQSVQGHLRRERVQRVALVHDDSQAQQLITRSRRQLAGIALIFAGVLLLLVFGASIVFRTAQSAAPVPIAATPTPVPWPPEMMPIVPPADMMPAAPAPELMPTLVIEALPGLMPGEQVFEMTATPVPAAP